MLLLQYSGLILTLLMGTFILLSHWLVTHSQSICFFKFDSSQGVRLVCNCWHGEGPGWGAKLQVNLGIDQQKISYSDLLLSAILSVRNKLCPMTMTLSPKSLWKTLKTCKCHFLPELSWEMITPFMLWSIAQLDDLSDHSLGWSADHSPAEILETQLGKVLKSRMCW